jgi:plasmid stability protein
MVMLQIRNVPDDLHRKLKARAAMAGQSLSEYALGELRRSLAKPTRAEVLDRIAHRTDTGGVPGDIVEVIHAEREARDDAIAERRSR